VTLTLGGGGGGSGGTAIAEIGMLKNKIVVVKSIIFLISLILLFRSQFFCIKKPALLPS
jgi:hypothetical protein